MAAPTRAIAVIMAAWKGDRSDRIAAAAHSVFEQQHLNGREIRLYLGVDGPTGAELRETLAGLATRAHRIVYFPDNRGLAPVLNDLIALLEDEQIVFRMDADDICAPERFATQLAYLDDHPEVDILGSAIRECFPTGERNIVRYPLTHEAIVAALYWRNPLAHPTVCFRRRVLDAIGGYPAENLSEDLAMWFLCAAKGFRFGNIDQPLLDFTVDSNFWARRSMKRAWREYRVWTRGILLLHGISWRLALPLARLAFRLTPQWFRRGAYASRLRRG